MPEQQSERLDVALVTRGLARSRTHAARLVADGLVSVDGAGVVKVSHRVVPSSSVAVAGDDHYVSRAAHKLLAALDAFDVPVQSRAAIDLGASTGGFTQVLLERAARHVVALDVGHGQLAASVRSDPRVRVVEGFNARYLTSESLREAIGSAPDSPLPELVVADLSFISLGTVLPAVVDTLGRAIDVVALVKPQFEVGRTGVKEGIVRQAGLRTDAVTRVLWAAWDVGLATAGVAPSPIVGANGNHEYLVWLTAEGTSPSEWSARVEAMTG